MLDLLSQEEIEALTGYKQRTSQKAALNRMGIEHKERHNGSLVVARAHVLAELGCTVLSASPAVEKPNWDAI